MTRNSKRTRTAGALAGLVTAGMLLGIGVAPAPQAAPADRFAQGCAEFTPAVAAMESEDLYDWRTDELQVLADGRLFALSGREPGCRSNAAAARRLEHARADSDQTRGDTCDDLRRAVAENRQTEKGVKVNLDAARRYVSNEC